MPRFLANPIAVVGLAVTVFCQAGPAAAQVAIESIVLRPLAEAEVPARQTGVVARILVDEGDRVEAGAVLVQLDDKSAALAVQRAQHERDRARVTAENNLQIEYAAKALEVAEAELARSEESIAKFPKSISRSQLDVERLTVEKLQLERRQAEQDQQLARFDLQVKETELAVAQRELELHAVRAPLAGVVTLVRARAGEWVEPGAPVMRLIAVDRLRAEGFADVADVAEVAAGHSVKFALGEAGQIHAGTLRFVSPEIDPITKQVRIWAEIDNSQLQLRPGQQGQLQYDR